MEVRAVWQGKGWPIDKMGRADCELLIAGKRVRWASGKAIRLRPGPIVAELRVKGFRPGSTSVEINKGSVVMAEFRLEAEPRTITINNMKINGVVNGKPCGGTMWVLQGAEVGQSYPVEVAAPGYHTNFFTLLIEKPGEDLVTNVVWQPLMGFVRVIVSPSVSGSSVLIDGAACAEGGVSCHAIGFHSLSVSNADYYPHGERIEVLYRNTNDCNVVLKPKPASLRVEANPGLQYEVRDASGEAISFQGDTAELSPGTRTLMISAKGYTSERRDFVMAPNGRYSWKVSLERDGLAAFKRAEVQFQNLTNANWALLEERGSLEWRKAREIRVDGEDLLEGTRQYATACTNLMTLIENIKTFDLWKQRFDSVIDTPGDRVVLDEFGGVEWQRLRLKAFDSNDPGRAAQEYEEAYSALTMILGRCYEARDRKKARDEELARRAEALAGEQRELLGKAQSRKNRIDQSFTGRTGDDVEWAVRLNAIRRMVDDYEKEFGEGTQYSKWFGSVEDEVRVWRWRIDLTTPR